MMTVDMIGFMESVVSIEAAITAKVTERRRDLETELSKLAGFGGRDKAVKLARGGRLGPVAPNYRNSENPAETWAGRGLKPRWLTAAIEGGETPDIAGHFHRHQRIAVHVGVHTQEKGDGLSDILRNFSQIVGDFVSPR
jgi:DNA-binding protein H-NS